MKNLPPTRIPGAAGWIGLALGFALQAAQARTYTVAPDGSDDAAGSEAAPFATLAGARDAVRAYLAQPDLAPGDVTIQFRGGHYALWESVRFTDQDTAAPGHRVTYRAMAGEPVVFFGGASLPASAFLPLDTADPRLGAIIDTNARGRIRYVPLKAHGIEDYGERSYHGFRVGRGATPPMELFINGRAMIPARWPNEGIAPFDESVPAEERILEAGADWTPENRTGKGGSFRVDFDRMEFWQGAEDPWLDGLVANDWSWQSHRIASFDAENKIITLANPAPYGVKRAPRFFVENLLEEIDMPGEYFIDRFTGYLYLYPPADMTGDAFICVSTLKESMLVIDGASRLTFDGFIFDTGREGAIEVRAGRACRLHNLEVRNVTGTAIRLAGRNNGVSRSELHHLGGSGVILGGGDTTNLVAGHNYVEDTTIHRFAQYDKAYTPGVKLEGVGNRVSHCEIHDGPHGGITIHGNDHLIENCRLYDLIQEFNDFGAIYAACGYNPLQRGTVIRRNFFYNIGRPGRKWCIALYSDWFSQGLTIEENVFYRIGDDPDMFEFIAVVNSSGRYNNLFNNIFVDCPIPYERGYNMTYGYQQSGKDKKLLAHWREVLEDPEVLGGIYGTRYPELHRFLDEDIWFPTTCRFERNLVCNRELALSRNYIPEHFILDRSSKGQGRHEDLANARDNWLTREDPGFVDADATNFNLRATARVFDEIPGFRAIPFSEIGVRGQ